MLLKHAGRYLQEAVCGRGERRTAPRTAAGEELAVRQLRRAHPPRLQQVDVLRAGMPMKNQGWAWSLLWRRDKQRPAQDLVAEPPESCSAICSDAGMQGFNQGGPPVHRSACCTSISVLRCAYTQRHPKVPCARPHLHRQLLALLDALHRPHLHHVTWAASATLSESRPTAAATQQHKKPPITPSICHIAGSQTMLHVARGWHD